ncbi:hypothetical protein Q3G72_019086 [Acer saccharum]|nr:hypothetical protein Q3G72_019086 [Acer saccharum]
MVVLTSRDEKRGLEAVEKLKADGLSDTVVFHQLDVADPASVASLVDFIRNQFGKLDILVNNAGIGGLTLDSDAFTKFTQLAGGGFFNYSHRFFFFKPHFHFFTQKKKKNMEEASTFLAAKRHAVVTGANKGIGFEICKQLASKGVVVVLTSRDEKRGLEAVEKLRESGLSDYVIFHQLDVTDPASIASLAHFIKTQFGKLDILVNNAAYIGVVFSDAFVRAFEAVNDWPGLHSFDWNELATQNFEMAEECLKTNYYGAKRIIEAHIPLLQLSDSPRIVNVSSLSGLLKAKTTKLSFPRENFV